MLYLLKLKRVKMPMPFYRRRLVVFGAVFRLLKPIVKHVIQLLMSNYHKKDLEPKVLKLHYLAVSIMKLWIEKVT